MRSQRRQYSLADRARSLGWTFDRDHRRRFRSFGLRRGETGVRKAPGCDLRGARRHRGLYRSLAGSSTVLTNARADGTPMPGTLMSNREGEFDLTNTRIALSKKVETCSRSCRQATSMGRTIGATSERSSRRTSTFRSNRKARIAPGNRPKVLSTPRMWSDNRVLIPTS